MHNLLQKQPHTQQGKTYLRVPAFISVTNTFHFYTRKYEAEGGKFSWQNALKEN